MLAVGKQNAKQTVQKHLFSSPPHWVANSFVYQIFPDRFKKSKRVSSNQDLFLEPWRSTPSRNGFKGGDLYGVIEALDYLQEIGVTCLYLNPIFNSAANHRYHTYDYMSVDPLLGGNQALFELIESLHLRGMRIILDGVFNHCGRGFWAFHHLIENAESSPYRDWFIINDWPINPYPGSNQKCGYSCWWNDPALPKFNHGNPQVQNYLIQVGCFWIERGIDGWRLDVPDEVPDEFWVAFRKRIKKINSEAWIVGEIWGDARKWLKGEHFDGVMNYRIGWSSLCWVGSNSLKNDYINPLYPIKNITGDYFLKVLETTLGWYSSETNCSQLNLLDSHDVPRALHTLDGDVEALKLALLLLFLNPGAPCIYYGTEIGLNGGKEPSCREAFPWKISWKVDLRSYIRSLWEFRKNSIGFISPGLDWEVIGLDGLHGYGLKAGKKSIKTSTKIDVFINRSRTSSLAIPSKYIEKSFYVGSSEMKDNFLPTQSGIVFT